MTNIGQDTFMRCNPQWQIGQMVETELERGNRILDTTCPWRTIVRDTVHTMAPPMPPVFEERPLPDYRPLKKAYEPLRIPKPVDMIPSLRYEPPKKHQESLGEMMFRITREVEKERMDMIDDMRREREERDMRREREEREKREYLENMIPLLGFSERKKKTDPICVSDLDEKPWLRLLFSSSSGGSGYFSSGSSGSSSSSDEGSSSGGLFGFIKGCADELNGLFSH